MKKDKIYRTCCMCKVQKSTSEFHWRNKKRNLLQSRCKPCGIKVNNEYRKTVPEKIKIIKRREYLKNKVRYVEKNISNKYGISSVEYHKMFMDQNDKCYICYTHKDDLTKGLVVDHNHNTGKIRKLLCCKCNSLLGFSNENIEIMKNAINYLIEHK